jgi:hypothetical protein
VKSLVKWITTASLDNHPEGGHCVSLRDGRFFIARISMASKTCPPRASAKAVADIHQVVVRAASTFAINQDKTLLPIMKQCSVIDAADVSYRR